jgi:hypothetical protein
MVGIGPGLPHGTSPWAEGPQEDKNKYSVLSKACTDVPWMAGKSPVTTERLNDSFESERQPDISRQNVIRE